MAAITEDHSEEGYSALDSGALMKGVHDNSTLNDAPADPGLDHARRPLVDHVQHCPDRAGRLRRRGVSPGEPGHRHVGQQHPRRLGLRHHQLRVVDRHRPRRDADLGDPAPVPAEVAHLHQPLRRDHDPVLGDVRRLFPLLHVGRPWFAYWLFPYPSTIGLWPQFRSALDLGRLRGQHLPHSLHPLLVPRARARFRGGPRELTEAMAEAALRNPRPRLARRGQALEELPVRLPDPGGPLRPRWCSRCTRW